MINLLNESAPRELSDFVTACATPNDLVTKLVQDPVRLFIFLQNMKIEGNEILVRRLFFKISLNDLEKPEVKKTETMLRNRGMLNRTSDPDIVLKEEGGAVLMAHNSILALESPYFRCMKGFSESLKKEIEMKGMGFSPEVYKLAVEFLYLSDKKRKKFLSSIDKTKLPQLSILASYWQLDELKKCCDDELCNSLGGFNIEKSDIQEWLAQADHFPKFATLLNFINRVASEGKSESTYSLYSFFPKFTRLLGFNSQSENGELGSIIDQMQTPARAALLAKCTPKEIEVFTEFELPPGTFGATEWEITFPVTIKEVPPLPANIRELLEQEDPCEPGKKLKETCILFLRPQEVVLHESGRDITLFLNFDGVEELAMKANNPQLRTQFDVLDPIRDRMNELPIAESGWVLQRKKVIPWTVGSIFDDQKEILKGCFKITRAMDVILLNVLTYASEGLCHYGKIFGKEQWYHTRCREKYGNNQMMIGSMTLTDKHYVFHDHISSGMLGLSGTWEFDQG